jgi:hypothetical protein
MHADSRKVVTWASLIHNEHLSLEASEIEQYSCTKLLREMEVVDSDDENEESMLAQDDVEMVCLPKNICAEISNEKWVKRRLEDIYTLPDMNHTLADQVMEEGPSKVAPGCDQRKENKGP